MKIKNYSRDKNLFLENSIMSYVKNFKKVGMKKEQFQNHLRYIKHEKSIKFIKTRNLKKIVHHS